MKFDPGAVAADADGNIYIVEAHRVRKTAPNGDLIEIISLPTFSFRTISTLQPTVRC
jgi:DICT domain-containing protein